MPKYLEIAETLVAELAGTAPGTRVPSEPELARRFAVSRAAARSALQELERRMLVRRQQGAGTFVNSRIDYIVSRGRTPSWHTTVEAAGATPRSRVKAINLVELSGLVAERLEREPGTPAHRIEREFFIDDLLTSWSEAWIPADVVPDMDVALHAVESIDVVLRQMGRVDPVRAWYRLSVEVPPPHALQNLGIEISCPAYHGESFSRDALTGEVLLYSAGWTRVDAVRVIVELT